MICRDEYPDWDDKNWLKRTLITEKDNTLEIAYKSVTVPKHRPKERVYGGGGVEQGIFFEPGEGMALSARGSTMVFKAVANTTGNPFSSMERVLPVSNRRPPPHRHQAPEGFYVLEGSIEFVVGDQRRIGGPGVWALVPGGVAHPLGNAGDTPAKLLIIHAPAADAYFMELQELWGKAQPPTPEEERLLMKRHGLEPVELEPLR